MENMKNIVVLKELPSNMIEEAIVILKPNIDLKKIEKKDEIKVTTKGKINSKDYLIKEAESIISTYISDLEKPKKIENFNKKLLLKYKRTKVLSVLFGVLAFLGIVINLI